MVQTADKRIQEAIISLGSNLGNRKEHLQQAKALIAERVGTIVLQSDTYNTVSWGNSTLNNFLNEVIMVKLTGSPIEALKHFLAIEKELGRKRSSKDTYENRSIDIDLLYYDHLIINSAELTVPHPRLHLRKFVLVPMCQILPNWVHPILHKSSKELLEECPDTNKVEIYS